MWALAVGISATLAIGSGAVLTGHPVPDRDEPAPPLADGAAAPEATPVPSPTPTPPPTPTESARRTDPERTFLLANGRRQPARVSVPASAGGRYRVVAGEAAPPPPPRGRRAGKVIRYVVEVERGLPFDGQEFADEVHRVLNDRRSWGFRFQRVRRGPARIRVSLSSPAMTDRMCRPLITFGALSCWNHGRAVINARRWNAGARGYGRDVASYREYVVNHEVGHGLGHGHARCPGPGRRAPVMLQQTKSLYGCRPNAWPSPGR
ncbi:DUF3152 domain-containing protein [Streptosporangium jomthongense]|uniref:DUF3152 domain-containing protein n=1 Tax=Streptosporangium jomthongense TaxID=1193683 RepID=A0ABV8F2B0_9ACTN